MESGIKQNAVSYSSGMSNVPNNLLCSDDSCSEVVGLTSENGEMRPIQKAKVKFAVPVAGDKLLYVHTTQSKKLYIYRGYSDNAYSLKYACIDDNTTTVNAFSLTGYTVSEDVSVTSVGNTLIFNSPTSGVYYCLWNGSAYQNLGSRIPSPQPKFWLDGTFYEETDTENLTALDNNSIADGEQEIWNNIVIGDLSKALNSIKKQKGFYAPFFALCAVELYDGSYYLATSPVALYPNFQAIHCGWIHTEIVGSSSFNFHLVSKLNAEKLYFKQSQSYSDWSDIVKNVTIFVTEEVSLFDTNSDAIATVLGQRKDNNIFYTSKTYHLESGTEKDNINTYEENNTDPVLQLLNSKSNTDVIREMGKLSIFYKLCDIGTVAVDSATCTDKYFSSIVLENLTTQTRLDVDGGEYFDHVEKVGKNMYSYNGRLHIANIKRGFFDGFKQFISKSNGTTHTVHVAIETPQGIKIVTQTGVIGDVGKYFYYPDPRAKYIKIETDNAIDIVMKLEEHPGLNGAFCIDSPLGVLVTNTTDDFPTETFSDDYELLTNKVLVSEVDNPFVFRARGYNTVGKGEVKAITSNTAALSEGQFGQFPLLAFATDGIWALGTNSTGTYSTVAPLSREICNNPNSVTQTDSAVFFTSEKGLMVVAGSQVKCVSEQMNGKTEKWGNTTSEIDFKDFLKNCSIAYDYRDSMLWIFNASGQNPILWHYVYNIKTGTFSKMADTVAWVHEVSDYPDTLLQSASGNQSTPSSIYSLLERVDQNAEVTAGHEEYEASITTRPMKFGNALTLKSIRQIKHLMDMKTSAQMSVTLWASNDCRQWVQLQSLRGKPWKFYRLKYSFSHLVATDRFIGTVFVTQESRNDKLR